ncbi:PREDICTED: uncharacterized protein LOC105123781 isoform X1 [Populus euphratica]|uniref:Dynein light chain n=1 Tax=Populus euphratica TaxID=75702 RepID=A0AAJ6XKE3_POPEU|nr:PREDICTED: uncharacterized protein LOC105123781 isoform X1 [Populus euphratica]
MEGAELELERRSKFLSSLIEKKKAKEHQEQHSKLNVRVRAADMSVLLQDRAFRCARDQLDSMPGKLDSKRLALALKKLLHTCAHVTRIEFSRDARGAGREKMTPGKLQLGRANWPIPQEFDAAYGPAWHCIVGTSFGSYVTHSTGGFLYFSIDKFYILLFRTAVEPLDR